MALHPAALTTVRLLAELDRRTGSFDFDGVVHGILGFMRDFLSVDRASVALLRDEPHGFSVFDTTRPIAGLESGTFVPYHTTHMGTVVRTGEVMYRPDIREAPPSVVSKRIQAEGLVAVIIVPMFVEGKCIGCLNAGSRQADGLSEEHRTIIELAASRVAYAIQAAAHMRAIRANEARFRSFFEVARDGFVVVDAVSRRLLMGNAAFAAMLGRDSEEIPQLAISDIHPPSAMAEVQDAFAAMVSEIRPVVSDLPVLRADGRVFYADVSAQRFVMEDRVCVIGVFRDATERRRREEALLHIQKLESIRTLAAGIAHDFNNLLTAILGNVALAELNAGNPDLTCELLKEARSACQRAAQLTQQLLTFSKGGTPVKTMVDVGRLVKEAASLAARGSNARVETSQAEPTWAANADPGQLAQMVQNLLINAIQSMPDGGEVRVRVENDRLSAEAASPPLRAGAYVRIEVRDQGHGIAPENLDKIFLPFFTTKGPDGSGLGLAVVHSIVRNHNGDIKVESTPGCGSTFRVWIPAEPEGRPASVEASRSIRPGRGRILFMDDEPAVRTIASTILFQAGYDVACVADGKEAVECFSAERSQGHTFDLAILDLTVPGGMSGSAAARAILELEPAMRIIVSSGYCNDPVMGEFRRTGLSGVLPKPYTPAELCLVVDQVLRLGR